MQETNTKNITRIKIEEPPMYKVVMMNDDETTFDFVIFVLEDIFLKSTKEATRLCMEAHLKGSVTVGIYPRDIAQSKLDSVESYKRKTGFPLTFKIVPERI